MFDVSFLFCRSGESMHLLQFNILNQTRVLRFVVKLNSKSINWKRAWSSFGTMQKRDQITNWEDIRRRRSYTELIFATSNRSVMSSSIRQNIILCIRHCRIAMRPTWLPHSVRRTTNRSQEKSIQRTQNLSMPTARSNRQSDAKNLWRLSLRLLCHKKKTCEYIHYSCAQIVAPILKFFFPFCNSESL